MKIGIGLSLTRPAGSALSVGAASAEVTGATEITVTITGSYAYAGFDWGVSPADDTFNAFDMTEANSHQLVIDAADGVAEGVTYAIRPYVTNDPLNGVESRVYGSTFTVSVAASNDPYFASVVALLHMNGTDASTTITDETARNTWEAFFGAEIDTAESKYGGASAKFDGSNDLIRAVNSADWDFGSGDFAVECWVRFAATSGNPMLMSATDSAPNHSWFIQYHGGDGGLYFSFSSDGTTLTEVLRSWTPSINTWYHVAVARNGSNLRIFIDGTQIGATYNISTTALYAADAACRLGTGLGSYLNGWLDDVRITKGSARGYTANFTAPSAQFPDS
jgi:hypothetical protein